METVRDKNKIFEWWNDLSIGERILLVRKHQIKKKCGGEIGGLDVILEVEIALFVYPRDFGAVKKVA